MCPLKELLSSLLLTLSLKEDSVRKYAWGDLFRQERKCSVFPPLKLHDLTVVYTTAFRRVERQDLLLLE